MNSKHPPILANAWVLYKRLLAYIGYYWPMLLIGSITSAAYSGINTWFVFFLKHLLNKGLIERDQQFLTFAPCLVLVIFIARSLLGFLSNYSITAISYEVIARLRQDLFAHLQKLPASYYDYTTSGTILSTLLYSVDQIANASADILIIALQSGCLILGLIGVMFSISWKLTLLYFLILPLVIIIMRISSQRIRYLSFAAQTSITKLGHHIEENVEGYKVVRTFSGEEQEIEYFSKAVKNNKRCEMKIVVIRSLSSAAVQLVAAGAFALTLCIATLEISHSILSPGGFVAICTAMLALLKPMKDMALVQNKLHRGLTGAQAIFDILDHSIETDIGIIQVQPVQGEISFTQVSFTYQRSRGGVHDISLTIEPGEIIALVGRSGSGKSTLINLLLRFYTQQSGCICLDHISIDQYPLKKLRQQFSIVSQQVTLFHDTIANNIAYGNKQVSQKAIHTAAESAYAIEFIEQLPDQFNTVIGENGILLSGGQRQRLAIARAILKNAPILILDEATSSLDTESERYIQIALRQLMKNRTTLIIAHRLSTIKYANRIIVMHNGRLVEMGDHAHLLTLEGYYSQLYYLQFKEPHY